ncbi:calretinin-like isoform X2 [Porites lutea]|uniref:calretinin-like isoform X2 n=1 Tax=Porites lutea TaxID=51062 RepID=UPI003CC53F46
MAADSAQAKPYVTSFQGKSNITSNDFLKIFRRFDKDGNGYIEAGELDDFLVALHKETSKQEQHDPKSIAEMKEEILYKYDENFDGKLELEELTRILPTEENFLVKFQHHDSLTSVEFFKVWTHYDQDQSGFIESDELKGFLRDLLGREGHMLNPQRLEDYATAMLDLFDKNKDGKLSLSEMSKILPVEENFMKKFGDGNGYIADEELDALMHDILANSNQPEADDPSTLKKVKSSLMETFDKNKDGKITKEELKFMLSPAGGNECA